MPMCGTLEAYSAAVKVNSDRLAEADGEREQVDTIRDAFRDHLEAAGVDPDKDIAFIHTEVIRTWCHDAIPDFGGRSGRAIPSILRNWMKTGMFAELSERYTRWPHGTKGRRGMGWNIPAGGLGLGQSGIVKIIGKEGPGREAF